MTRSASVLNCLWYFVMSRDLPFHPNMRKPLAESFETVYFPCMWGTAPIRIDAGRSAKATVGRGRPTSMVVAMLVAVGAVGPLPHAGGAEGDGGVTITSPLRGALVTGTVEVAATGPEETTEITFEWSKDGGQTWRHIAVDSVPEDGFAVAWNTGGFSGPAQVRARRTTDAEVSDTIGITVDNTPPTVRLRTSRRSFSPNRDGRADRVNVTVRTSEETEVQVVLKRRGGPVLRTWRRTHPARRHSLDWGGRAGKRIVADGRYRLEAVATDRVGLRGRDARPTTVDTRAPRTFLKRISPEPLKVGSRVALTYRVRDRSPRMRLDFRVTGDGIDRSISAGSRRRGPASVRRKFTRRGGLPLPTGGYRVRLVARDDAGNAGRSKWRPWRVHRAGKAHVYRRLEKAGRKVSLTFDDCYDAGGWMGVLRALRRHRARGTFFCNGVHAAAHPNLARKTLRWGNAIGSHTSDHALLTGRSAEATEQRLESDAATWWRVARTTTAPYFRPPYGAYDQATLSGAGKVAHTRVILWDVDPSDWRRPGASAIAERVLRAARPGSIVVMHALPGTAQAIPRIVQGLRSRNLEPATLPTMFRAARHRRSLSFSEDTRTFWRGVAGMGPPARGDRRSRWGRP